MVTHPWAAGNTDYISASLVVEIEPSLETVLQVTHPADAVGQVREPRTKDGLDVRIPQHRQVFDLSP